MKKALSLILAVIMTLTLAVSSCGAFLSFAEEENVARGKTVSGSGGGLDCITDGNTSTDVYWDGGVAPASAVIDLEGYYDISRVNVITYYGDMRFYHYVIEISDDGLNFTQIGEKSDNKNATAKGTDTDVEATGRYVRITLTKNSANASVHLVEVSVYGVENKEYKPTPVDPVDVNDPDNVAYHKPTRSNSPGSITAAVNDGKNETVWSGMDFPRYVDIDLEQNYEISKINVVLPTKYSMAFTVYGSIDGVNFTRIYKSEGLDYLEKSGVDIVPNGTCKYRVIRVNVTGNGSGSGSTAQIGEVRVYGTPVNEEITPTREKMTFSSYEEWMTEKYGTDFSKIKDKSGKYDVADTFTENDTVAELNGIVTRLLGEKYVSWFEFVIMENTENDNDYYTIEDAGGKIRITGNTGVNVASGLNWYLKYYCNVHVSQQNIQGKMPEAPVAVGEKVRNETAMKLRYAYNYCTLSYTMAFFGYDDWRRELDWLYLNGINLILDTTATEALWVYYLQQLGYNAYDALDYVCGYAYKAWWLMGNLEGYGGTVSDSWVYDMLEMARINQRSMAVMGAQPALQTFVGAMPMTFGRIAKDHLLEKGYAKVSDYMAAQGSWAGALTRPNVLRTDYDGYSYLAQLFYDSQEFIYGQVTDYFCGDVCHEGGKIPEGLAKENMAKAILDELVDYNENAHWMLQRWWDNPMRETLDGFGDRRTTNVMVIDLASSQNTSNYKNTEKYGSAEFGGTPWIYSTLDVYGGNPGVHGALLKMCSNMIEAKKNATFLKGVGMTPEATQNNPIMMDLYWELVWLDEAPDLEEWTAKYIVRRYGKESKNALEGWKRLLKCVYMNNADDGGPTRFAICSNGGFGYAGGYYVEKYQRKLLLTGITSLMKDFDLLKDSECYIYDLVDLMTTYLATCAQESITKMNTLRITDQNKALFTTYGNKLLTAILLIDELGAYEKDSMVGTWIGRVAKITDDERTGNYDDYSKDNMVFNAKALITMWHSSSLIDYAGRRYNGVMSDYYYQSWNSFITDAISKFNRGIPVSGTDQSHANHYLNSLNFILNDVEYSSEVLPADGSSNARGIKAIYEFIAENYADTNYKNALLMLNVADKSGLTVKAGVIYGAEELTVEELIGALSVPDGATVKVKNAEGKEVNDNTVSAAGCFVELYSDKTRVDTLAVHETVIDPEPTETPTEESETTAASETETVSESGETVTPASETELPTESQTSSGDDDGSNTTLIIVIVAVAAVLVIGGIVFFLLKKKKK